MPERAAPPPLIPNAQAIAAELSRLLPGDFRGEVVVHVERGRVVAPLRVVRDHHLRTEDQPPAPAFASDAAARLGSLVPAGWWGKIAAQAEGGRVKLVKITTTHRVGVPAAGLQALRRMHRHTCPKCQRRASCERPECASVRSAICRRCRPRS